MKYAEGLAKLTAGNPADALTNMVHNRIGGVADCLTDRAVNGALRAQIVGILEKAQADVAAAIQTQRKPRGFSAGNRGVN